MTETLRRPAIADGFHAVPRGKIATVVTHLEMRERPPAEFEWPVPPGVAIRRVEPLDLEWYRDLYRRVGQNWLWFSRLQMPDVQLAAIIRDPNVEIFALTRHGLDEGLLELDFRQPGACELAFFGLTARLIGTGAGRTLMQFGTKRAWSRAIERFWVHTCTLDHPAALAFYQRAGFVPFAQEIEIADDPRMRGDLPMTAARHVPLFKP